MDIADILARLRAHQAELQAAGVLHAGVFGSVARGEAGPGSDIDILIQCAPGRPRTIYDYVGIQHRIGDLFPRRVDVVDLGAMRDAVRARALRDLIPAF